jgi:hypothetical protein
VTSLGEFSPNGAIVYFDRFFKFRISTHFCVTSFLSRYLLGVNIDKKMSWATFWAIFSPAQLVTLQQIDFCHLACTCIDVVVVHSLKLCIQSGLFRIHISMCLN